MKVFLGKLQAGLHMWLLKQGDFVSTPRCGRQWLRWLRRSAFDRMIGSSILAPSRLLSLCPWFTLLASSVVPHVCDGQRGSECVLAACGYISNLHHQSTDNSNPLLLLNHCIIEGFLGDCDALRSSTNSCHVGLGLFVTVLMIMVTLPGQTLFGVPDLQVDWSSCSCILAQVYQQLLPYGGFVVIRVYRLWAQNKTTKIPNLILSP